MAEAVLTAISANALKGRVGSQKLFMELARSAEAIERAKREQFLETVIEYKENARIAFKKADEAKKPRPDLIPHPDDIILNTITEEVIIDGPLTYEQRDSVRSIKKLINTLEENIEGALKVAEEEPEFKKMTDKDIKLYKAKIDKLKKLLPSWSHKDR